MKVRSVANGNIIDLPADHGLVAAGIYVPVDEAAAAAPEPVKAAPPAKAAKSTAVEPLTTKSVKRAPAKAATKKAKPARKPRR